jgi:hypothetical protein
MSMPLSPNKALQVTSGPLRAPVAPERRRNLAQAGFNQRVGRLFIGVVPRAMTTNWDFTIMTLDSRKSMDRFDTLAGVFFFGFMAYLVYDTHFILAIICVVFASIMPYMVKSTRRAKDKLFGTHSDGDK